MGVSLGNRALGPPPGQPRSALPGRRDRSDRIAGVWPTEDTRWAESRAPRGMVATPHLLASQSGVAALRAGGNALDAAIAAAATIAVVYPHTNGIGGDNFWLIWDAGAGRLRALCGAGRSAAAATIDW